MAAWVGIDQALAGHREELDAMAARLGRTVDPKRWRKAHHPGYRCERGHVLPRSGSCSRCPAMVVRSVGLELLLVTEQEARRARWRAEKRAQRERMTPEELANWRRWRAADLRAWRARRRAREAAAGA